MKRAARLGALGGGLLLLVALFFGWQPVMRSVRTPSLCTFSFDDLCSEHFQQEINEYARVLDMQVARDPEAYVDQLKKQFPLIKSAQAELSDEGALTIKIECACPVCCVNQGIVVAAPDVIHTSDSYKPEVLEELPHLTIAAENMQSWSGQSLCSIATLLSSLLCQQYAIELGMFPELSLTNKEHPAMKIVTRSDFFKAHELEERGALVSALLTERGAFTGRRQRHWVADMRFEKQIVLIAN